MLSVKFSEHWRLDAWCVIYPSTNNYSWETAKRTPEISWTDEFLSSVAATMLCHTSIHQTCKVMPIRRGVFSLWQSTESLHASAFDLSHVTARTLQRVLCILALHSQQRPFSPVTDSLNNAQEDRLTVKLKLNQPSWQTWPVPSVNSIPPQRDVQLLMIGQVVMRIVHGLQLHSQQSGNQSALRRRPPHQHCKEQTQPRQRGHKMREAVSIQNGAACVAVQCLISHQRDGKIFKLEYIVA